MRMKLVDKKTGEVLNLIEIDPDIQTDPERAYVPPKGTILVEDLPDPTETPPQEPVE